MLLSFLFFIASALAGVDLNSADASALETLPGIGASKAAAIIQYRTDHGSFKTIDELDNVTGIGPSTLANVRDLVTVGGGKPGNPEGVATSSPTTSAPAAPSGAAPSTQEAAAGGCPVNINTADASGLGNLPGIGASKAAAILQFRTDNGAFGSCDALDGVSGIGPATLSGLRDCCVVK